MCRSLLDIELEYWAKDHETRRIEAVYGYTEEKIKIEKTSLLKLGVKDLALYLGNHLYKPPA